MNLPRVSRSRTIARHAAWIVTAITILVAAPTASAQLESFTTVGPQDDDEFGHSVASAGDVNGDGFPDLIVGAHAYDTATSPQGGRATLIDSQTGLVIRTHEGQQSGQNEFFGIAVAGLGDVDGDGISDYAVGASGWRTAGNVMVGRATIYSGASGVELWSDTGTTAFGYLGKTMAALGDLNGDGARDIAIGAYGAAEVRVRDGKTGALLKSLTSTVGNGFGYSIANCGDVDGDGVTDVIIGEPFYDSTVPPHHDCGRVQIFSGATFSLIQEVRGQNDDDLFGHDVSGGADVDGDAVPDFVVDVTGDDTNGNNLGKVEVYSGATATVIWTFLTDNQYPALFGSAVCDLGDFNLDGRADIAVGARSGGANVSGQLRVYSGKSGAILLSKDGYSDSSFASGYFGWAICAEDFDRDGIADLAVTDPNARFYDATLGWQRFGYSEIVLGCPAWWENYGTGWAGKNGVPQLTALNDPIVGGAGFDINLTNSLGQNTAALVLIGLGEADVPTRADGHLLTIPIFNFVLPLGANGGTIHGVIPSDPALYDFDLDLQALEGDSYASKKLSFTPGLHLHMGFATRF